MQDILKIENLRVSFLTSDGMEEVVKGMTFSVKENEIYALVGESGCGKSITAQTILRLLDKKTARVEADSLCLCGENIMELSESQLRQVRGKKGAMVFQDSTTSLDPSMKIWKQLTETLRKQKIKGKERKAEAIRLLTLMRIPEPQLRAEQYPHEFSGGMRQRVMLASALVDNPKLLIADEPTVGLDVTVQLELLKLIYNIQKERGMSVLLISHDLSVVANIADRVGVMYAGKLVEEGETREVFMNPQHSYTKELLKSIPINVS